MSDEREGLPLQRFTILAASMIAAAILAFMAAGFYDAKQAPTIVVSDPLLGTTIMVHVRGEVNQPGVYELPADARVQQALEAADGPTEDADLRNLNLAQRLADADVVDVPGFIATSVPPTVANSVVAGSASKPTSASGLINLNSASAEELEELPGIGKVLSSRIVDYRTANGPFRSVDDLVAVNGISAKLVDKIRSLVTVGP